MAEIGQSFCELDLGLGLGVSQPDGAADSESARDIKGRSRPLLRLFRETRGDGFLPIFRNCCPGDSKLGPAQRDGGRNDFSNLRCDIATIKGRLARKHFIQRGADSVDVVGRRRIFAEQLLRAHVIERPAGGAHADVTHRVAQRTGDSEISDLQLAPAVHHQVGRL